MKGAAGLAALALAGLLGGCALVAGLDGDRSTAAGAGGATTTGAGGNGGRGGRGDAGGTATHLDAGTDASGPACALATYPPPPAVKNAGGDVAFVVAVRTIDLGDSGTVVGLDLDGECTGEGDGPSCLHPAWMSDDLDDGEDGRDAQSARLFAKFSIATLGKIGSAGFSKGADAGTWSILLRVSGYSGDLDDDEVEVALYPSAGLHKDARPPTWLGTDTWPVPPTAVVDGKTLTSPRYVDHKAYVSAGRLVASLPESEILLAGTSSYMPVKLTAGFLVATVETSSTGWALTHGTLAARWTLTELFTSVANVRQDDQPICTDSSIYAPVKAEICKNVDIFSGIGTPTTVCDSISVGLGFSASPALLGAVEELPALPIGCAADKSPLGDHCP